MTTTNTPVRFWLRKKGTMHVELRTAKLAARDDMEPISEEDAQNLLKAEAQANVDRAQSRAHMKMVGNPPPIMLGSEPPTGPSLIEKENLEKQVKDGLVPESALVDPNAKPAPKTLAQMDRSELVALAGAKKVQIADNWGDDTVRKHIQAAMDADAASTPPPASTERDGE